MALLDLQGMQSEHNGGGGKSTLSLLCDSAASFLLCL
ncbi:SapB/AmfS family lanthipeptide [Actinomadura napierensis]